MVFNFDENGVELDYKVVKGTEYFVSLETSVLLNEECNVMVNSEELIGTTENRRYRRGAS
jgi:hypothetical protein